MDGRSERDILKFIGDFYEGSAGKNRIAMNKALDYIENLIGYGEVDSDIVRRHFNEMFSGRQAYNTLLNVNEYPAESIIRELFQNAFDCCYDNRDIKLAVNFKGGDIISISYNEVGFTFENFLCYLGFGLNYGQEGKEYREGRFGIGAKSVFANVEWLAMRSNNIGFRVTNRNKSLYIEELDLRRAPFAGTEIMFKTNGVHYEAIKDNLLTLAEKKGAYINIPELCFAFSKKKVLNYKKRNMEAKDRTFNIAVLLENKLAAYYKILKYRSKSANAEVVRFMRNNKNTADFICEEEQGLTYLIPFAVSSLAKEGVFRVLSEKYNYFSTYELTGYLNNEEIADEKLSAFFISVPNDYITSFRTGVRHDREHDVKVRVEADLAAIISKYSQYFVLLVTPLPDDLGYCCMHPESYAFEFIKNFIMTSRFAADLKNSFQSGVSVRLKGEEETVSYSELLETACAGRKEGVTEEEHLSGFAYNEYIEKELEVMRRLSDSPKLRTLYAGYTWQDGDGNKHTVFRYEFYRNGGVFVVDSIKTPRAHDFNLHCQFPSATGRIIQKYLGEDKAVRDDNMLVSLINLLDERYDGGYKITTKAPKLCLSFSGEEHLISLENMEIKDIAAVMDVLAAHRYRFDTNTAYSEAEKLFMTIFCGDGSASELLRGVKAHGGTVAVELDSDNRPVFSAYGRRFPIADDLSIKELADIAGVREVLAERGLVCGRKAGFDCEHMGFVFEKDRVAQALGLSADEIPRIGKLLENIFTADFGEEKVIFFDGHGFAVDISEFRGTAPLYAGGHMVIMTSSITKAQVADLIELVLCGENIGILRNSPDRAESVNLFLRPAEIYAREVSIEDLNGLAEYAENLAEGMPFAADFGSFRGYGCRCPVCGYESRAANCYGIKEFKFLAEYGTAERYFKPTLFLCENCAVLSKAWVIRGIAIGGLKPFEWLAALRETGVFPREMLEAELVYAEQTAYYNDENTDVLSLSEDKSFRFRLTPLMLARWIIDNNIDSE